MVAQRFHFTANYLLNPQHPVTVILVGTGGNGSQTLTQLARIDQSLKRLGHPGLHVTCFDNDEVSESNIGRQMFSPADIGINKAVVLITRINQYFGTSWKAVPQLYNGNMAKKERFANIVISCVDSVKARNEIDTMIGIEAVRQQRDLYDRHQPYNHPYYWMDLGNSQHTGQFIIGSLQIVDQPKASKKVEPVAYIQSLFEKFPQFRNQKTKDTEPSCSLAEALQKQDLFINSFLVQTAMATLWKLFREGRIRHHGAFVNLQTLDIAPISV